MWDCFLFWGFTDFLYAVGGFFIGVIKAPYHMVKGIVSDVKKAKARGKEVSEAKSNAKQFKEVQA